MKTLKLKKCPFSIIALFIFASILTACSSKQSTPTRVKQSPTQWDHDTIREKREAEKAQGLNQSTNDSDSDENAESLACTKVSQAEMRKAKMSGCRPLDPKEGHGVGMFCCDNN